jgi:hypothetical protein
MINPCRLGMRIEASALTKRLLGSGAAWCLLLASILLCGCEATVSPGVSAPATSSASSTRPMLLPPEERCTGPTTPARSLWLRTNDGVDLDAVEFGEGAKGAVFLHMSPSDLCDWWPYAKWLADDGVHGMLIDLRCNGQSGCPTDPDEAVHPDRDVLAAAQALGRNGARQVTVVGASYGGACALVAAAKLGSQVDGVASLSGEPQLSSRLDVLKVIGKLRSPLLLAVAPGDPYVTVPQTQAMLRAAGS